MAVYDVNMSGAQFADGISAQSLSVSTAAVGLTVPTGANAALIQVHSNTVRVAIGTDPTTTLGLAFVASDFFYIYGVKNLNNIKFIRESADATVTAQYFKITDTQ